MNACYSGPWIGGVRTYDSDISQFYTRITAASILPVTLDQAVAHLRVASSDENAYIQSLIAVAAELVENATGRALLSSEWTIVSNTWPSGNFLPVTIAPVDSIESISYYADGETTITELSDSEYSLATLTQPAQVIFADSFSRPSLANRPDAVQVNFVAGATAAKDIPPTLRHAVLLVIQNFYDRRAAVEDVKFDELPFGLRHLLESNRVGGWVA